jgi:hypothetical protein
MKELTVERLDEVILELHDGWLRMGNQVTQVHLDDIEKLVKMHRPRTERKNSGCIACGLIWPCPTITEVATPRLGGWLLEERKHDKFWSG